MASIFGLSDVLVWLGPDISIDRLAFATIHAFEACVDYVDEDVVLGGAWKRTLIKLKQQLNEYIDAYYLHECGNELDMLLLSGLIAVGVLAYRTWFSRVWVVQEVLAAGLDATMCLGSWRASFIAVEALFALLQPALDSMCNQPSMNLAMDFCDVRSLIQKVQESRGPFLSHTDSLWPEFALESVVKCSTRQCSDPRDRIFSLYGKTHLCQLPTFKPDYCHSTLSIYKCFVLGCLAYKSPAGEAYVASSRVLCLVGTSNGLEDEDWPSWIPDFDKLTSRSIHKLDHCVSGSDGLQNFPSLEHRDPTYQPPTEEGHVLKIRGKVFGRIQEVWADWEWPRIGDGGRFDVVELANWYTTVRSLLHQKLEDRPSDRDLLCLLSTGISEKGYLDMNQRIMESEGSAIPESMVQFRNIIQAPWEGTLERSVKEEITKIFLIMCSHPYPWEYDFERRLCLLQIGDALDIGWFPRSVRRGDEICIVSAGGEPFLLRRRTDGRYRILGDAWVLRTTLRQALNGGRPLEQQMTALHALESGKGMGFDASEISKKQATSGSKKDGDCRRREDCSESDKSKEDEFQERQNQNRWTNVCHHMPWLLQGMDEIELR